MEDESNSKSLCVVIILVKQVHVVPLNSVYIALTQGWKYPLLVRAQRK